MRLKWFMMSCRWQTLALPSLLVSLLLVTPDSLADNPKRGWAGEERSKVNATNSGWYYNWGQIDYQPTGTDAEYVPMFYSAADVTPETVAHATSYTTGVAHVLGFNEPDQPSQGTSTVAEALAAWPMIESTGLRTVSPANLSGGGGRAWSNSFLTQAETLGYRVDVVAFHWYGNYWSVDYNNPEQTAADFLSAVDYWWDTYQKPLWITEFGVRDTSDQIPADLIRGHNARFLELVTPVLDSLSYVERYAWFQWEDDVKLITGNPLTPTKTGEVWVGALRPGELFDVRGTNWGDDVFYLRGGTLSNLGRPIGPAVKFLDVLTSEVGEVGELSGVTDWSIADGWLRIRNGGAARKTGTREVGVHDTAVTNSGLLEIADGSLRFSGTTQATGGGRISLLAGGELRLGSIDNDPTGVTLNQKLEFRGGEVISRSLASGKHVLNGAHALYDTTRLTIDGEVEIRGSLDGVAAAELVKSGPGVLQLTATTNLAGDVSIEQGTLKLGAAAALDSSPRIEVLTGGELDASARRHGLFVGPAQELHVDSGAIVRGPVSIGGGGILFGGGTFQNDLAFNSAAEFVIELADGMLPAPMQVLGNLTAGGALSVTLGPGFAAPQAGDTFDLLDFGSITGSFAEVNLPTLDEGLTWNLDALATTGAVSVNLVGDYNADGVVDARDYAVWREGLGSSFTSAGFTQWRDNYGAVAPAAASGSVPEPVSCVPLLFALAVASYRRQRTP